MPDFNNGKIYKLWSPQGDEIYIGSTIQPLYKRLNEHKNKRDCNSKYLFENYDNVRIELIELYPCNSKMELNKKEGEYIRENECLNRCIAGRTKKEYNEDNKEHILEKRKEWYENNKEHKKKYDKEYYENNKDHRKEYRENNKEIINKKINCECGGKYTFSHKTHHFKTKKHLAFMNSHQ
jgi:hypothetical protein